MKIWGLTDTGKVREVNQDSYYIGLQKEDEQAAVVVCDGMGGAKAGNIASAMAVQIFSDRVKESTKPKMTHAYMKSILTSSIEEANRCIYEQSQTQNEYHGMGTTVVALLADGENIVLGNIGDSRAYLVSGGEITRITTDHSVVEEMVTRGEISREQAKSYPGKNLITRALGTDKEISCDLYELAVSKGDCILLCTDGLTNTVDDQEILYEIYNVNDPVTCCERLIAIANARGGPDNITAVLLKA